MVFLSPARPSETELLTTYNWHGCSLASAIGVFWRSKSTFSIPITSGMRMGL